jgi:hypothetical protein
VIAEYPRFTSLGWLPLLDYAARYKEQTPDGADLKELQELEKQNIRYLPNYFRAARQSMTPKELFNHFGGTLINKLISIVKKEAKDAAQRDQLLIDTIERQIMDTHQVTYDVLWDPSRLRQQYTREMMAAEQIASSWDSRWLDWFIQHDALNLASAFARPGHEGVRSYLRGKLQEQPKRRSNEYVPNLFMGLERAGVPEPERLELLMDVLENNKTYNPYVFDLYLFNLMQQLPVSYLGRLEAIIPKYRYECRQQLEYLQNSLRSVQ